MHHFSCQKNYCIQRHCGTFSLGFIPLGNRFWHQKNGIAMATSCQKNFRSLYGKDVMVVFDSKNCIGSVSKCLHVWKHSYHRILFSLEQSKGIWRLQCWKQVLLWGCCLGCGMTSMYWHWILGNALWRPFTWKKGCQQVWIPFPEVLFQFSDAVTVQNPHQLSKFLSVFCHRLCAYSFFGRVNSSQSTTHC